MPSDPFLEKIALRLKQLREQKGVTQAEVLAKTGIHIGRIEMAQRDVSVTTLQKLCRYFKVPLSEFFKGIK